MSNIDFIVLYSFLFALFYCLSRLPQRELNERYWAVLSPVIISFALIIGLRYGWGNDYLFYKWRIEHPAQDEDMFFGSLNMFLTGMGLNYARVFSFYALCLVWGGFLYIKSFRDNRYMLSLFLPAIFFLATFMIRQGFSTAFVFWGFYYMARKKYILGLAFLIIAIKIHTGILTFMLLPVFFSLIRKWYCRPFPYIIIIPLYLFVAILQDAASSFFGEHMAEAFSFLENFGKFSSYSDQSDYWFGTDGISESYQQGVLTRFLSIAFETSIIYLGAIALKYKKDERVVCLYNTVILGMFIMRVGFLLEIIHRIGMSVMSWYFIPLGFSLFTLSSLLKRNVLGGMERKLVITSRFFCVLYLVLYYGRLVLMSPTYEFVWNS